MIDRYTEQRIKDTANIVDVFRHYGFTLKKQGSGFVTLCPFHNERHPSMQLSPAKNICKCFSCGIKAMDAVQFVMDYNNVNYPEALKILANIVGIVVVDTDTGEPSTLPTPPPPPKPDPDPEPTFTDISVMRATMRQYDYNPLFTFVSSLFGAELTHQAFTRYHVGTAKFVLNSNQGQRRSVVFWQTDEHGNVRAGKIVAYNEQTGKRIKGNPDNDRDRDVNWAHIAARNYSYNLRQCLFGQHLITPTTKRVNIVESEKTAILSSLYFGERNGTWIATGGKDIKTSAKRIMEAVNVLDGKDVVLYPDADGYSDWQNLCETLNDIGINTTVSTAMKAQAPDTKYDIGDFIVSTLTRGKRTATNGATSTMKTEQSTIRHVPAPADLPRATATTEPTTTPPTPTATEQSPTWTPDIAPPTPIAPGETEEQARANNASILNQAFTVVDLLKGGYNFHLPTPEQIAILDPNREAPQFAPF